MTPNILFLLISLSILLQSTPLHAQRNVTFINACSFPLGVVVGDSTNTVICSLNPNDQCNWTIPSAGWSGRFYRNNLDPGNDDTGYPSATLAEFTFAYECTTGTCDWNWDWYDISIIPPGCPGSATSYQDCVDITGEDGYDVPLVLTPLACPTQVISCGSDPCPEAYGFPDDNSKTNVCQVSGDWEIQFCLPGGTVDIGAEQSDPNAVEVGGQMWSTGSVVGLAVGLGLAVVLLIALALFIRKRNQHMEVA